MKPIPKYGDLMTLEKFTDCCKCGGFMDYDGCGNYCTAIEMSDKEAVPSDITNGIIDYSYSHVVWFNK
jgi:hypothetical protein